MNESRMTRRFLAVMISGTSLFMSIVYLLFFPNLIGPGFVWILGTMMLLAVSSIGLTTYLGKNRGWHLSKSIFIGIGILLMLGLISLYILWYFIAFNMNQAT